MKILIIILSFIFLAGCQTLPLENLVPTAPSLIQVSPGLQHRVEAGQTLWRIAKLYNVEIDEILTLNQLPPEKAIEIGQVLLIPARAKVWDEQIKTDAGDFIWPLRGKVICVFGANDRNLINKGINIQASAQADVVASRSGKVVFYASNLGNFGKTIIIDHGDGLRSVYSKIAETFVHSGDPVIRGALIGKVGTNISDKNSYLHFEIRKGALPQNPLFYLS